MDTQHLYISCSNPLNRHLLLRFCCQRAEKIKELDVLLSRCIKSNKLFDLSFEADLSTNDISAYSISNIIRSYRDESFTEMTISLLWYEIVGLLSE
jgi:hypothetical protein